MSESMAKSDILPNMIFTSSCAIGGPSDQISLPAFPKEDREEEMEGDMEAGSELTELLILWLLVVLPPESEEELEEDVDIR